MAKEFTEEDDALLAELGVEVEAKKAAMVGAANVPAVGALASLDHVQRQILETARGRVTQRGRRQSGGADDAVQPRQRAREALDDALGVALSADEDNGCARVRAAAA